MRIFRIWVQTIIPPVISQGLYFVIFGGIIGSQISSISGINYMQFLVPGLVMMAIITNSFGNTASSFFGSKFQKNIEEMLISPLPNWTILLGFVSGGVIRGFINGFIVLLVTAFFVPLSVFNLPIIIIFSFFTAMLFALFGFLNGLFANSFDEISIIPTFVLTPLTYLGGVFYSISSLPSFWQNVSKINPIVYMVDGFRYGFYGISSINIFTSLIVLISVNLLLFLTNWHLLNKGYGLKN